MKTTTFSVAAIVLIAAGIAIFWPGRNAGPGVAVVTAQAPAVTATNQPADNPVEDSNARLAEVLNRRMDVDYDGVPLKDVMANLTQETGITFHLSLKKLEEASVSADSPVHSRFRKIRLSTLLDLMLKDFELTYVENDDIIVITTPEDAESKLLIRVYDCRDLLAMAAPPGADKFVPAAARSGVTERGGMFSVEDGVVAKPGSGGARASPQLASASQPPLAGGGLGSAGGLGGEIAQPLTEHDLRASRLMKIIITSVDNQTWDEVGGPGSISEYNGLIVVSQTAETHKKVERVFDMLREAAGLEVPKKGKVVR
jgi:hypothetical protein